MIDLTAMRVALENIAAGKIEFHDLDMLVLALGIKPSAGTRKLQEMLGLQLTSDGFLAFACNWCSYACADYAGVSRLQYPPNVRIIRTMCSGRVHEKFIWHAFEKGAPVVLVSGCHIGDCHYIDANHWTEKRIGKIHKKMEKLGTRKERLQLAWISAAEGIRFSKVMADMETLRQGVSQKEIEDTMAALGKDGNLEG